jgi:cytochrome c oxidase assembly factor CtaG
MMLLIHGGQPHNWHDLARAWSFEPLVITGLALTAVLFTLGQRRKKSSRIGEQISFALGWFALVVALISPLHAWGRVLFSAHMSQHEMLMLVAAPLLVLGRPVAVFLSAFPVVWARRIGNIGKIVWVNRVWRALTIPFVAWLVHAIALWIWHVPVRLTPCCKTSWCTRFSIFRF